MIGGLISGVFGGAWTVTKNAGRAVRGGTKQVNEAGEHITRSSMGRLVDDIKKKGEIVRTGVDGPGKYGNDWFERQGNRVKATFGVLSDSTLGVLGQGVGFAGKNTVKLGAGAAAAAFVPTVKGLGHLTKGTMDLVGDTAINAAGLVHHMTKSPYGSAALFGAPIALAFGKGAFDEYGGTNMRKEAIQATIQNGEIEALPGMVTPSPRRIDNFGADGDLVFAMHNMR
ncbi:hypothetical protein ACK8P5_25820 (plasmid) [Paenibacillus sp. EC2-1]|uniref:hypothetical protein n=1 Tax=Paenibacillus sp. EC2-1 TaxID=3388665 RepID=UPI003BEEC7E1